MYPDRLFGPIPLLFLFLALPSYSPFCGVLVRPVYLACHHRRHDHRLVRYVARRYPGIVDSSSSARRYQSQPHHLSLFNFRPEWAVACRPKTTSLYFAHAPLFVDKGQPVQRICGWCTKWCSGYGRIASHIDIGHLHTISQDNGVRTVCYSRSENLMVFQVPDKWFCLEQQERLYRSNGT